MRYDSHDNPWVNRSKLPDWTPEKDTDYLDGTRIAIPDSPMPNTNLSLRDAEIQFEKAVYSATRIEHLPEPLPPPYAWAQSDPSLLLCPLPENCMWPRVTRGGGHIKLMLRAAREYEIYSEAWDDHTKKEFIRQLWNLRPQGTVFEHPLFTNLTSVANLHLLRVLYGIRRVNYRNMWHDAFGRPRIDLPPICDNRYGDFEGDPTLSQKRDEFLAETVSSLLRQRCERTIFMLQNHPETLLSDKQSEMKPAGGNAQEPEALNWTPQMSPVVDTPCDWPSLPPYGVSERDLTLALEVYNRWSLSWSRNDKKTFIEGLKYLKRTPAEAAISSAYFYKNRTLLQSAASMYCLCITWGERTVANAPGLRRYFERYDWTQPSLYTAPPAQVTKLSSRTGIEPARLTRGLPSWGTYLPILGLTMCPRVEGGVPQPGNDEDPLPTHPEIGWTSDALLMGVAADATARAAQSPVSEAASGSVWSEAEEQVENASGWGFTRVTRSARKRAAPSKETKPQVDAFGNALVKPRDPSEDLSDNPFKWSDGQRAEPSRSESANGVTFGQVGFSQPSSSGWGQPWGGASKAISAWGGGDESSRNGASSWAKPPQGTSFTFGQPSLASPSAHGESAQTLPSEWSTKREQFLTRSKRLRVKDEKEPTQRRSKPFRLQEQYDSHDAPASVPDASSQIELATRERNSQLVARIEGIISQGGNRSTTSQQIASS